MVLAASEALMPAGTVKRVGKITGSLILVLALLHPLAGADYDRLFEQMAQLPTGTICREDLEAETYGTMRTVIEQKLAAYIVDKGAELGAVCTAEVTCRPGEGGIPVPAGAVITGDLTSQQKAILSRMAEEELGIDPARQSYHRGEEAVP